MKPVSGASINLGSGLSSGLVLCVPLNEGSGTTIHDNSTNNDAGTLFNISAWVGDATYTYALQSGNPNSYATIPNISAINIDTFSIAFLFKTTSTTPTFQWVCGKQSSPANAGVYAFAGYYNTTSTGSIEMDAFDNTHNPAPVANQNYSDGNWHYVIGTRIAQGVMNIFVDGIYKGTTTDTTTAGGTLTTAPVYLLCPGADGPIRGEIGCFMMWNRILTGVPGSTGNPATGEIAALSANPFAMYLSAEQDPLWFGMTT